MIDISDELRQSLANSMTDRIAVIAAYVDRNGDPHVGFYGSLHAYSHDQVALWARKQDSELVATIPLHPKVEFVYSDMANARVYRLGGTARIVTDEVDRNRIFEGIHEIEQGHDPERTGAAIVVDLDHITGRDSSGRFSMRRDVPDLEVGGA